ncbi:Mucin-associated surface protein (MASP) subgroup S002 [Trypanosoma cruzi]|uniref:Mucin-associated surface protein (MASP) subgroup S002 n=1 Tax=Trypanosoma cruzi TaxID=5693 RepID=A0A7J6XR58_TRYCR|nr:Mucin-associated surface protein (MASP) subgroup S002 [Trypanosoma cruzi]KAF5221500.1 Mucin-associated surface protein (MASP) subgroup S002 [Trypanosoma cruzi]
MAMMMTGRVLLVCALCVLWCGAGGGFADEEKAAGSGSGAELPPASKPVVTPPVGSQGLQNGVTVVTEEVSPISSPPQGGDADDDDEDTEDGETEEKEGKRTAGQSGQGETGAIGSDSREEILSGNEKKTGQSILSAKGISPSGSRESNADATQTEFEKKNTDENPPAIENPLTTGNGENTLPGGGNLPSSPEDVVDSRKQDGEETTSEGKKNVPSPATAATPQSHRDKGSEGTGEDTKATTVTANKTDTTNTQNSDSSTAVSHTTSPLLLLVVVACAAAAAVVSA